MKRLVFGNVHLGYVVIETEKFADWRRFGRDAIGMHLDEALPDVMRFRLDDNECRFLLQRGPAEDATALGWSSTITPPSTPSRPASAATAFRSPRAPPRRRSCAASNGSSGSPAPTG